MGCLRDPCRVVQLLWISFNELVRVFVLELAAKSTLEEYPQETTSPWKLGGLAYDIAVDLEGISYK